MYGRIRSKVYLSHELTPEIKRTFIDFPLFPEFSKKLQTPFSHYLIFYHASSKEILGYLPLQVQEIEVWEKKTILAIYQGKAVLPFEYLKMGLDQFYVSKFCFSIWIRNPFRKIVSWLNVKSFSNYKLLLQNLRIIYPSPRYTIPLSMMQLIVTIGKRYFPRSFNPTSGTIQLRTEGEGELLLGKFPFEAMKGNRKEIEIKDREILYFLKLTDYQWIKNSLIVIWPFSIFNLWPLYFKQVFPHFKFGRINERPDPVQKT